MALKQRKSNLKPTPIPIPIPKRGKGKRPREFVAEIWYRKSPAGELEEIRLVRVRPAVPTDHPFYHKDA